MLAEAVGAGIRTREHAFRDHYVVTPKPYLITQRLFGARPELMRSDATQTLVRDVAFNLGF